MNLRRLLLLAVLAAAAGPARAALHCSVNATGVPFPAYDATRSAPTNTVSTITVSCSGSGGDTASYALDLSSGSSNSYAVRTMRKGGVVLDYNLYSDPGRSIVWGDGSGGCGDVADAYAVTQFGSNRQYSVYGSIFARQNVPAGVYTDAIVVTLKF